MIFTFRAMDVKLSFTLRGELFFRCRHPLRIVNCWFAEAGPTDKMELIRRAAETGES